MNLSTVKWAQWDKTQSRELLGLLVCACIALYTIVAHNIAQKRPDNFLSYPPDSHHCSGDVYFSEGAAFIFRILVKSQFWGSYTLIVAPMGVKFGTEEWSTPPCQISPPSVQRVTPAGRKTLKSPSELLIYRCFALHAMLLVMIHITLTTIHTEIIYLDILIQQIKHIQRRSTLTSHNIFFIKNLKCMF